MCGGAPDPPAPQPNYTLMREAKATEEAQAAQRAEQKRQRFEAMFGMQGAHFGRAALMSGSGGGAGFSTPALLPTPTFPGGR